jgi:hypothetical protein
LISAVQVKKRLDGAIERMGLSLDRERAAKSAANSIVPEVLKIIAEEVREAKRGMLKAAK